MNYGGEIDSRWQILSKIELTVRVEVFGGAVDVLFFLLELPKCLLENPLFHARPMLTRYSGLLSELRTAQHVFRGPELSTEDVDTLYLFRVNLVASLFLVGLF